MKLNRSQQIKLRKIGELSKFQRMLRGYSQSKVAEEIGVTVKDIKEFENGRRNNALILFWYFGTELD